MHSSIREIFKVPPPRTGVNYACTVVPTGAGVFKSRHIRKQLWLRIPKGITRDTCNVGHKTQTNLTFLLAISRLCYDYQIIVQQCLDKYNDTTGIGMGIKMVIPRQWCKSCGEKKTTITTRTPSNMES